MQNSEMPVVRPVPIKTVNQKFFVRIFRWIFSIRKWELMMDWTYNLPEDKPKIIIKKGFIFDGASIPRIFWAILSPTGLLLIPGLIHDFAYKHSSLIGLKGGKEFKYGPEKGRLFWDKLFKDVAVKVNGFTIINRIAWFFLVLFGWYVWNGYRKKEGDLII